MEEIVMNRGLRNQEQVFNVMPELDIQSHRPPLERRASESFAQGPNSDQHDDGKAIVKSFRLDQPRIEHPQNA